MDEVHAILDARAGTREPTVVWFMSVEHGENTRSGDTLNWSIQEDELKLISQLVTNSCHLNAEDASLGARAMVAKQGFGRSNRHLDIVLAFDEKRENRAWLALQ